MTWYQPINSPILVTIEKCRRRNMSPFIGMGDIGMVVTNQYTNPGYHGKMPTMKSEVQYARS